MLHAARWIYRKQKLRKKRNLHTIAQLTLSGYIFATKACINRKKFLNSSISSKCPHNTVNFGPLTAEIGWRVWGTPANFNGFRVVASLLQRRRSTEVNQTLHDVWPSPVLVHYIYMYFIWGLCPLMEFWQVQNSLCLQILRYPTGLLAVLLRGTRAMRVSQTLRHCIFTWQGGHPVWHWAIELPSYYIINRLWMLRFSLCKEKLTIWLYCVECPQYSIRLEVLEKIGFNKITADLVMTQSAVVVEWPIFPFS